MASLDDSEKVEKFIKLLRYSSDKNHERIKQRDPTGHEATCFLSMPIFKALLLKKSDLVPKITRDSWMIYSHIDTETKDLSSESLRDGLFDEVLVKLTKVQPMKSFLKLDFRQVINFMFNHRGFGIHLSDTSDLMEFIDEMRLSYTTLCLEDRQIIRPTSKKVANMTDFIRDANQNASFIINWSIIEAAKYCICHKFAPEISANDFFDLLDLQLQDPLTIVAKMPKRFLINFLANLDKFIVDRVMQCSTNKHTFVWPDNIEQFYRANSSIFNSWFLKNRNRFASLSLVNDDPAECWRNINLRLYHDLTTKFHTQAPILTEISLKQTVESLDVKTWHSNLALLVMSAKQLEDLPLLYGISALSGYKGMILEISSLNSVLSNLEGRYQCTYDRNLDKIKSLDQHISSDSEEQSLIEFFDSCIELGVLNQHKEYLGKLKSPTSQYLYNIYLESKLTEKTPSENAERFEKVERWLSTWSDINGKQELIPAKRYTDLVIPTYLNLISKSPQDKRLDLIQRAEWLISRDLIAQCVFPPYFSNKNIQVYHVLIELLKGKTGILSNLIGTHAKNLRWNHQIYRHLCDVNMIDTIRKSDQQACIDLIQYRAAKYNRRNGNFSLAATIAQDLNYNAKTDDVKIKSSLLLIKNNLSSIGNFDMLRGLIEETMKANLSEHIKCDLSSKILRKILRMPTNQELDEMRLLNMIYTNTSSDCKTVSTIDDLVIRWKTSTNSGSELSNAKILLLFSARLNDRMEKLPQNDQLMNACFKMDLELLISLCLCETIRYKSAALECATRILSQIVTNHNRLSQDNFDRFNSERFIESCHYIWLLLKTNLISIVSYKDELTSCWKFALINILKVVIKIHPSSLIYTVIVNRLDLKNELACLNDNESKLHARESCSVLLQASFKHDKREIGRKIVNCQQKLSIWNELLEHITLNEQREIKWLDIVAATELFLKEIRKISFLCGEYLKILTIKVPKRLNNFLDYFMKYSDPKSGTIISKSRLEECENKLKTICDHALSQIDILLHYEDKMGKSQTTSYDRWFCQTFNDNLTELQYRISLLAKKKPFVLSNLRQLVRAITELLNICRSLLSEHSHKNRHKLYMEMISPMLSRLESSLIPMPDCCHDAYSDANKPLITIHKISQTVNLIVSKTCPKKLRFVGTDGISRSFLLKAHEDLRLDQLVMDLFATINTHLLGNKETQHKFRIRRYSVTPVSNRSGLIQWIDAPSLCSSYKTWLNGPEGKRMIQRLYESSCEVLCTNIDSSDPMAHINCHVPQIPQISELFYQLLWVKTFSKLKIASAKPLAKPHLGNIIRYRNECDPSIIQDVVEHLKMLTPDELISNQFWYTSRNAQSYWTKTREFIRSCATISIAGYIIGLGDRHPENILLDYKTGEVIHIDLSICFELGKTLSIPEKVPYRLTQNLIRAFGFAGLEGGFTHSCRSILKTLKDSKSTILHLIDPINLDFMIGQQTKLNERNDNMPQIDSFYTHITGKEIEPKNIFPKKLDTYSNRQQFDFDMCSQESVELHQAVSDIDNLLLLDNPEPLPNTKLCIKRVPTSSKMSLNQNLIDFNNTGERNPPSDFHLNIKTPTKILASTASNMHERVKDKLSGSDDCICSFLIGHNPREMQVKHLPDIPKKSKSAQGTNNQPADLIILEQAQSIEDQVEALIIEATSIKNIAAMFEGWMPWL